MEKEKDQKSKDGGINYMMTKKKKDQERWEEKKKKKKKKKKEEIRKTLKHAQVSLTSGKN